MASSMLESMASLSGSELRVPGTSVNIYLGDWVAIGELIGMSIVFVGMLMCFGVAGYAVRRSQWPQSICRVLLGLLAAGCLVVPFGLLKYFGPMRNLMAHFSAGFGVFGMFRMLELMGGNGPKGCDKSAANCATYCCSPVEVLFDGEGDLKQVPPGQTGEILRSAGLHFLGLLTMISIGRPSGFAPFLPEGTDPAEMPFLGFPFAMPAVYLQLLFFYCFLTFTLEAARGALALAGIDTYTAMKMPVLKATSVLDFWGRRWNLTVHRLMKRGFFMPVLPIAGPVVASIVAFIVSGLFHEYCWYALNVNKENYRMGGPTLFFIAQFVLCSVEVALKKTAVGRLAAALPSPVQTALVSAICLPFGPWFLQGLHGFGLMEDIAKMFPHVALA